MQAFVALLPEKCNHLKDHFQSCFLKPLKGYWVSVYLKMVTGIWVFFFIYTKGLILLLVAMKRHYPGFLPTFWPPIFNPICHLFHSLPNFLMLEFSKCLILGPLLYLFSSGGLIHSHDLRWTLWWLPNLQFQSKPIFALKINVSNGVLNISSSQALNSTCSKSGSESSPPNCFS